MLAREIYRPRSFHGAPPQNEKETMRMPHVVETQGFRKAPYAIEAPMHFHLLNPDSATGTAATCGALPGCFGNVPGLPTQAASERATSSSKEAIKMALGKLEPACADLARCVGLAAEILNPGGLRLQTKSYVTRVAVSPINSLYKIL